MNISRTGFAAVVVGVLIIAQPAAAQYGPPPWQERGTAPRHQQPPREVAPRGVTCVPSGFARLTRNCTRNTGGCQPMPESCSYGWCCP